jgi:tail tube protein
MFQSEAISSQGVLIQIETGTETPAALTTISNAAPPVAATTAPHALADGDVVKIAGVATMTAINGVEGPVDDTGASAFNMIGVDMSAEAAGGTGGTYAQVSFENLCEAKTFQGFDGQASEIDVTTMCSEAKEYRMGLQDFGSFGFEMNYVPTDVGTLALQAAKASGEALWFRITLPGSLGAWVFKAFVKQMTFSGGVDTVLSTSVSLRITGAPTFVTPTA